MTRQADRCTTTLALALLGAWLAVWPSVASAKAIPVELRQTKQGWQLLRGGEPYFIRGAGGDASLKELARAGGNSVRTWGADDIGALLDAAHALGLSVTVGIWLGHERHGFDYGDEQQVARQKERVRRIVLRHRNHPALLLWGLGNETEGFEEGDNPIIWSAVNDIAEMVKDLDPNHPTMTVTAFVHGERIDYVHKRSPGIDIHGINAYAGARTVPGRLRAAGATKPFVLTEFGPAGPWEMPTTDWGAPYEQTSTQKAAFYRTVYKQAVLAAPGQALGSYAFLWGHKMEGTATWFGMFTNDGARTAVVDTMTELWTGSPPADRAPSIEPLVIDGKRKLKSGDIVDVRSSASDPDGGRLCVRWLLQPESGEYTTGGDFRPDLPIIEGAIFDSSIDGARVRMPKEPGPYRLFIYVYDESGNAATANIPLLVEE